MSMYDSIICKEVWRAIFHMEKQFIYEYEEKYT